MDPNSIEALRQIMVEANHNALVGAWWFWMAALALPAVSAWLGAYFRKRGENAAILQDLELLKKQIEETTKITEQIKTQVGFEDWWNKESITIRRQQLERISLSLYRADNDVHVWWLKVAIDRDAPFIPTPDANLFEVRSMVALYHPELKSVYDSFEIAWMKHIELGNDFATRLSKADNLRKLAAVNKDQEAKYDELSTEIAEALAAFEKAIARAMATLLAPSGKARIPRRSAS